MLYEMKIICDQLNISYWVQGQPTLEVNQRSHFRQQVSEGTHLCLLPLLFLLLFPHPRLEKEEVTERKRKNSSELRHFGGKEAGTSLGKVASILHVISDVRFWASPDWVATWIREHHVKCARK